MKPLTIIAGITLALVLLVGLPLFVRSPLWVDATYHDISAKNVLQGGVHYRDVFETNLPGMVWLHCLVRSLVGWSSEAIRWVDLVVVGAAIVLLTRPMHTGGITLAARLWFLTAASLFYLYETEFIHVQRDGWMLLPTVLASLLRLRQGLQKPSYALLSAIGEGFLWGCAVWIKPHALVPALLVWLVSWRFGTTREQLRDTFGLFAGGLLAGGLGTAWLVATGTWPHLWDVMFNWNGEYYEWSWQNTFYKVRLVIMYFAPFSLLHLVAVPLALYAIVRKEAPRAIIAALYLGWLAEATFIQKIFDYAHAPPTLLGLAVLALYRVPVGPLFLAWCTIGGIITDVAAKKEWFQAMHKAYPATMTQCVPAHAIARIHRLKLWPRCWTDDSLALKDQLSYYYQIPSVPEWVNLHYVAEYLRTLNVQDYDVIAWHDSTHPLYLELNIRPGIRFPHVITVMRMRSKIPTIRDETFRSPAKYVVSDLVALTHCEDINPYADPGPTNELPDDFPAYLWTVYPWNQPVIYRAGRYLVHRIDAPHGTIDFPLPGARKD